MKYRAFGRTGVQISEVGLGTWQLGSSDWGKLPEKDALAILHRAVERGVNFLDTADVYGLGVSERAIGRFLKETRETVHVATKLGRRGDGPNGGPQNFSLDAARRHTQSSLNNLGLDCLFLQQWHCIPTEEMQKGEAFEHLRTIQKEGLIQHWGASVESVEEAHLCMQHEDCASLQVIYNIFRQKLTDEVLPAAKGKGVAILARVPLASGLLAGKFKAGHRFAESDHRNYNADGQAFNAGETFAGVPFDKGVQFAEKVREIVRPPDGVTLAQLALRWVLDHDAVSAIIPGATRAEQADQNAAASDLPPLGDEAHAALRELYEREIAQTIRGKY